MLTVSKEISISHLTFRLLNSLEEVSLKMPALLLHKLAHLNPSLLGQLLTSHSLWLCLQANQRHLQRSLARRWRTRRTQKLICQRWILENSQSLVPTISISYLIYLQTQPSVEEELDVFDQHRDQPMLHQRMASSSSHRNVKRSSPITNN